MRARSRMLSRPTQDRSSGSHPSQSTRYSRPPLSFHDCIGRVLLGSRILMSRVESHTFCPGWTLEAGDFWMWCGQHPRPSLFPRTSDSSLGRPMLPIPEKQRRLLSKYALNLLDLHLCLLISLRTASRREAEGHT